MNQLTVYMQMQQNIFMHGMIPTSSQQDMMMAIEALITAECRFAASELRCKEVENDYFGLSDLGDQDK